MFSPRYLFAALALIIIVISQDVDKIEPVDLAYKCITIETNEANEAQSPILLLHGIGGSHKIWNRLSLLLADRTNRKVCAVDLRNHGDSPWSNEFDVEALTVDIGHFIDKKGFKKVNIIGQSLGGKTAIHFALKNPDRVDSIVVEDISPGTISQEASLQMSSSFKIIKAALESIPGGTTEDEAKKAIVDFMNKKLEEMGSTEKIPEQFSEFIEVKFTEQKWHLKFNIDAFEEALKHTEEFFTESIGVYEGPAAFIYGTKSPFKVFEDKENILKMFPNAEFVPVKGAGHIIQGVFREFDEAVLKLLDKVN